MINLSRIMKRAWEIKKEDSRNIFGLCLKMAWVEFKAAGSDMLAQIKNVFPTFDIKLENKGSRKHLVFSIKSVTVKYSDFKNCIEQHAKYEKGLYNSVNKTIELKNLSFFRPYREGRTLEQYVSYISETLIMKAINRR